MAAWLKMSSLLERLATLLTPHLKRGGFDPRNPPAGYATVYIYIYYVFTFNTSQRKYWPAFWIGFID